MTEGGLRALIVEDDRAWRELLAELLHDMGLQVDSAGGYEGALARLRAVPYRLAVVDLSLVTEGPQNHDGLRVLEAVRAYAPGCVPIMLTGFATVELAVGALTEYGAYTCLRKETFRRSEFRGVLARILAGSSPGRGDSPGGPALDPATIEQVARLTAREREVLELLVLGLTNKGIANRLVISTNTVKGYLKSIFEKLEVNSRAAAVAKAVSAGIK